MIQMAGTLPMPLSRVAQSARAVLQATDCLRDEAALEMGAVLHNVTGKQLKRAGVPTMGPYSVSRALNGGDNNPLYRLGCVFIAMKRLGMGREGALRLLNWLQEIVDAIWPPEEAPSLEEALDRDAEQDPKDEYLRFQTQKGCPVARVKLIEETRKEIAVNQVLLLALHRDAKPVG